MIEATRNPGPFPKFSDIPKVPTKATTRTWEEVAAPLEAQRTDFDTLVAALPPASQQITEAEAERLRKLGAVDAPPADATAQAEALGRTLRRRANPPPAPR